jgi:hypothetical protein
MKQYIFDHIDIYTLQIAVTALIKDDQSQPAAIRFSGPATEQLADKLTEMFNSGADFLISELPERPNRDE